MFGFIEQLFELWFLIRGALKAQGHTSAVIKLAAYDVVTGQQLAVSDQGISLTV